MDIDGDDITEGMLRTMLRLRQQGDERMSDKNTGQKLQKLKKPLTAKEKVPTITVFCNRMLLESLATS